MADMTPQAKTGWLAVLVERRSPRGRWVYLTWLVLYGAGVMMFAADIGIRSWAGTARLWPLLIPAAVLVTQLARPTILGWLIICLPTFLYFGTGVYYDISRPPRDMEELIGGTVVLALIFGACVALTLAARPKRTI